ncbi:MULTISPECIES: GspH/FimT family pseudopilin [unclassified Francisella]|uniref:GspH/FimT family pseudopilin n=1 Tax=unclassified Francisella TaxID=2610885 RepID=UPI002E338084|nr:MULTISPECIES: GspH/FimT family pseudopilin [unclassified Francisella]MED7819876.1 GspH/FimT family pseudopilin [Francisella sp. 19S2-4]MED7830706.1 GspH/FimT family pseudopilin [Francisella sp. 19S2-10]
MKSFRGYSLVEMLVVITIFVILAVAATSYIRSGGYSQESQTSLVENLIKTARITALQNNETVTLCSSDDRATCLNNTLWRGDFIVALSSDNTLLGAVESPNSGNYYASLDNSGATSIQIEGRGRANNNTATLTLCEGAEAYSEMEINSRGNVTIGSTPNSGVCTG